MPPLQPGNLGTSGECRFPSASSPGEHGARHPPPGRGASPAAQKESSSAWGSMAGHWLGDDWVLAGHGTSPRSWRGLWQRLRLTFWPFIPCSLLSSSLQPKLLDFTKQILIQCLLLPAGCEVLELQPGGCGRDPCVGTQKTVSQNEGLRSKSFSLTFSCFPVSQPHSPQSQS